MSKNYKKYVKSNNTNKKISNKEHIVIKLEDSESDIDNNCLKTNYQQKNKKLKLKTEKDKFLGRKHKSYLEQNSKEIKNEENNNEFNFKQPKISNDNSFNYQNKLKIPFILNNNNNSNVKNLASTQIKRNNNKKSIKSKDYNKNKYEEENSNIVVFPYEFTERIINSLSCEYCGGIYIKPYVINMDNCGHIFCLGCIIKMLGDNDYSKCFLCKTVFNLENIKYSEITDFYIKIFFPQITQIIEENKKQFNNFFETEARKYYDINKEEGKKIHFLKCELRPFKEIPPQNKLPKIFLKNNIFMIQIKSENENIISIIKKEVIKRLNMPLKEKDIEIRIQGIEVSQLKTFNLLKNYLSPDMNEIFYYSRKGKK